MVDFLKYNKVKLIILLVFALLWILAAFFSNVNAQEISGLHGQAEHVLVHYSPLHIPDNTTLLHEVEQDLKIVKLIVEHLNTSNIVLSENIDSLNAKLQQIHELNQEHTSYSVTLQTWQLILQGLLVGLLFVVVIAIALTGK